MNQGLSTNDIEWWKTPSEVKPQWLMWLLFIALNVHAQSQNGTVEAKRHYQNAVAAIAKSDWATAKTELIQAENLATKNALIHYDLALAYSHTGDNGLSQSEASTAIELGLAGAEKDTAERLLKKSLSNVGSSGSEKSVSTQPPHKEKLSKTPTSDAEGRIWLFCRGEGKATHPNGTVEVATEADVYVFKASTEEVWHFDYPSQKLTNYTKQFTGFEIQTNAIVISKWAGEMITINRTTLAYYHFADLGGLIKEELNGKCEKISPDQVKAKPTI